MRRSALAVTLLLLPAAALAGFRVSTFKKETKLGADTWNAAAALDGKLETCWMVDPESENTGEWFEVDVPKSTVDKLGLVIGWQRDDKTFKDYGRVKTVRVSIFTLDTDTKPVAEQNLTFEDKPGMQVLDLNNVAVGNEVTGGRVRFTITEIYPGDNFPTIGVSEAAVVLAETDVPGTALKLRSSPDPANGKDVSALQDGNPKTFFETAATPAAFDVRADGFGLSSIGFVAGPTSGARPKTVKITVNDAVVTTVLADKPDAQFANVPAVVGYTGSAWGTVHVEVVDTWPGKTSQTLGIAEIKARYTNYEGI
jgi:hypothetical protein